MALSRLLLAAGALLIGATSAFAQTQAAVVCGTVADSAGAPVPGVAVTLQGQVGDPMTATTNKDGDYLFTSVTEGRYSLTFYQDGFKKTVRTGVLITRAFEYRADQRLAPSSVEATLGDAPPTVAYSRPITTGATFTKTITTVQPGPPKGCAVR